jgi:hypothetical protein
LNLIRGLDRAGRALVRWSESAEVQPITNQTQYPNHRKGCQGLNSTPTSAACLSIVQEHLKRTATGEDDRYDRSMSWASGPGGLACSAITATSRPTKWRSLPQLRLERRGGPHGRTVIARYGRGIFGRAGLAGGCVGSAVSDNERRLLTERRGSRLSVLRLVASLAKPKPHSTNAWKLYLSEVWEQQHDHHG